MKLFPENSILLQFYTPTFFCRLLQRALDLEEESWLHDVAWTYNNKWLAISISDENGNNNRIWIIDPITGLVQRSLKTDFIYDLFFSSDGMYLASAGSESLIWETQNWQPAQALTGRKPTWSLDGKYIATTNHASITIWDTSDWQELVALPTNLPVDDYVSGIDWHPSNDYLVTGSIRGVLSVWDVSLKR